MKDKWMNMGFEEDELKPYIEPVQDWQDQKRIDILQVKAKNLKKAKIYQVFGNFDENIEMQALKCKIYAYDWQDQKRIINSPGKPKNLKILTRILKLKH